MIPHVDGAAQELSTLGVCPCDYQILAAHEVPLKSGSYETIDVLPYGYNHFACKMPTLLTAMELIFEMNGRCTILREELREFDYSR